MLQAARALWLGLVLELERIQGYVARTTEQCVDSVCLPVACVDHQCQVEVSRDPADLL
jgi:hypothetical protein